MLKSALAAALALIVLAQPSSAAQPSAAKKKLPPPPPDYFPLKRNYWWLYGTSTESGGKVADYKVNVLSEDKQPDESIRYAVETLSIAFQPITDIYSKPKGWVLVHHQKYASNGMEGDYDPPKKYLKNPLEKGDSWEWSGTGAAMKVQIQENSTVDGVEDVAVPAGKFKAMKVTTHVVQGGSPVTKEYWFAPWIGLVKSATESGTVKSISELRDWSFKPLPKPLKK